MKRLSNKEIKLIRKKEKRKRDEEMLGKVTPFKVVEKKKKEEDKEGERHGI